MAQCGQDTLMGHLGHGRVCMDGACNIFIGTDSFCNDMFAMGYVSDAPC